jgi:hypothetical protein
MGSRTQIEIFYPANYIGHRIWLATRLLQSHFRTDRRLIRQACLDVSESRGAEAEMMTRASLSARSCAVRSRIPLRADACSPLGESLMQEARVWAHPSSSLEVIAGETLRRSLVPTCRPNDELQVGIQAREG